MAENKKEKVVKKESKELKNSKPKKVNATVKKPRVIKEENEKVIEKEDFVVEEIKVAEELKMVVGEKTPEVTLKTSIPVEENSDTGNRKTVFNLAEVIVVMIITAFFGALVGAAVTYVKTEESYDNKEIVNNNKYIKAFIDTYNELKRDFYGDFKDEELINAAINGMMTHLGDPHSQYFNAEETDAFDEDLSGEFIGMGAEIALNADGKVYVFNLFEKSPAEKVGIKNGDVILKVNNNSVEGLNAAQVANLIKGDKIGEKVTITVLRDGVEKDFVVVRDKIEIQSVYTEVFKENGKNTGYLAISAFNRNTATQFTDKYNELKKENIDSLIIDVRDNSGGHLPVAKEIANMFLNKGDVIYRLDTKGSVTLENATGKRVVDLPVVVLVNGGTASAAEILTAAIKENLDADVVGEKTYGKGTVQRVHTLSTGSSIKYTINTWLTPKGNAIDKVGIEPTVKISLDENYYQNPTREGDKQLQKAIELITK